MLILGLILSLGEIQLIFSEPAGIIVRRKETEKVENDDYDLPNYFSRGCHSLDYDPFLKFEILKEGSPVEYDTFSQGTVVKVSCIKGFIIFRLPNNNNTIHCDKGRWRPKTPSCIAGPCKIPYINHATFYERNKPLYFQQQVKNHGSVVEVKCAKGFKLRGSQKLQCHYGEWDLPLDEPLECVPVHQVSPYSEDLLLKRSCDLPPKKQGAIAYSFSLPIDWDTQFSFQDATEILYHCIETKSKARNWYTIVCQDGVWIDSGSFNVTCDTAALDTHEGLMDMQINSSCVYNQFNDDHVVSFHNDTIIKDNEEIPNGDVIVSRCDHIGKFRLEGASKRVCVSGQLLGVTSKCVGLNQNFDYNLNKPPTILFQNTNGSIVQSSEGNLVIYPGTTLYMDCLWLRKFGRPQWLTSNSNKQYHEDWAPPADNTLEYRIRIENSQTLDSGTFSCLLPNRYSHQIKVIVAEVSCPPLSDHNKLIYSTNATILGTLVTFSCKDKNDVINGTFDIFCMSNGKWSSALPSCEYVACDSEFEQPEMTTDSGNSEYEDDLVIVTVNITGTHVGAKAIFSCENEGLTLDRFSEAECQRNGIWSKTVIPLCKKDHQ